MRAEERLRRNHGASPPVAGASAFGLPRCDGELVLGQWQSVMLVDLDGPRERTVGLQLIGFQ